MNNPLFNPLPLPPDFTVAPPEVAQAKAAPGAEKPQERTNTAEQSRVSDRRTPPNPCTNWQGISQRLREQLASLDRQKLKQVLWICGIAAGLLLAGLLAVKLMPLIIALLAMCVVAWVLDNWKPARHAPRHI